MSLTKKLTERDFKNLTFPIYGMGTRERVVIKFPTLEVHDILSKDQDIFFPLDINATGSEDDLREERQLDRDLALRYVIFAYDKHSPFVQLIKNPEERKTLAAKEAGIKDELTLQYLVDGLIEEVNTMVSAYFLILNNREFELWISGLEAFSMLTAKVREPINEFKLTDDKATKAYSMKKECFDDAIDMDKKIAIIEENLFAGNNELKNIMQQTGGAKKRASKIEQMAKNEGNNMT